MMKVHHLNNSRSQRILWLLEELGLSYEIVPYTRDGVTNLAPPELEAVHPLGKSPVFEDGDIKIAESGAIVEYVVERHGAGKLIPSELKAKVAYHEWLHYAEGSAMLPLMLNLYVMRLGEAAAPLMPRIDAEITNHLGYIAGALGERQFLVGESLTGADIQVSFALEVARNFGRLAAFPAMNAYLSRLQARPAYKTALEKGGPYGIGQG
jgi:glutathione S-transferase